MSNSLGGRLRGALTTNPAVTATAVALALPAAYVVGAATQEPTAPFFALLLVGVRVPWLADPDVDAAVGDGSDAGSVISTPRAVLWAGGTAVVVAAALLGLYVAGVALGVPADVASAVAFFAAWVLPEPVVRGLDR